MKEVPGFAVLVALGNFLFFVGEEAQRFHRAEGIGWKDVPDSFRRDVCNEQGQFRRAGKSCADGRSSEYYIRRRD